MNIRTKLANSKQSSIAIAAILISLSIVSSIIVLEWLGVSNEYELIPAEDFIDKAAYEKCVELAKEKWDLGEPPDTWKDLGEPPDRHPTKTHKYLMFEVDLLFDCEQKWGRWKRIKKYSSFKSYVSKEVSPNTNAVLFAIALISLGTYIVFVTYAFYAKCTNLGWRRLSIVISFIPALVVAYYLFDQAGSKVSGEDTFIIIFGGIGAYISGIFIVLGGRQLVGWVKDGFKASK